MPFKTAAGGLKRSLGLVAGREMESCWGSFLSPCWTTSISKMLRYPDCEASPVPKILALPAPPELSDAVCDALEQAEDGLDGKELTSKDYGSLSKGDVLDILSKVDNYMETHASEAARLIGVSDTWVDKGLKSTLRLIKRRWMVDIGRKAEMDTTAKFDE